MLKLLRLPQTGLFFAVRSCVKNCKRELQEVTVVTEKDNVLRISFSYGSLNSAKKSSVVLKAPIHQELNNVLTRIKLTLAKIKVKNEMRRLVTTGTHHLEVVSEDDEDVEVKLFKNNCELKETVKNLEAWTQGTILQIGEALYEVKKDTPTVQSITLPKYIISGCIIRPSFLLECADFEDCKFLWYRSVSEAQASCSTSSTEENDNFNIKDECSWLKVGEGVTYLTSVADVGHKLKVLCIPSLGKRVGIPLSAVSENEVEKGPECFPFEERHKYTKHVTDKDSIRCVTYNILAKMYVDRHKFLYCSKKGRDIYYRKQLLLKELLGYNSDIICLQEVTERMFDYDLMPVLKSAGFDGFYKRKGGRIHEGLACFVRTSKFRVVENRGILLNELLKERDIFSPLSTIVAKNYKYIDKSKVLIQETVLQMLLLQHVDDPKRKTLVANTHLYSNKDTPVVRLIQSAVCLRYIEHMLKSEGSDSTALLFCGDFNSLPDSAVFKFIIGGAVEHNASLENDLHMSEVNTLRHDLCLESACGTPAYTNYTDEFFGCLDYIFYNKNNLTVSEVVPMPRHELVVKYTALPNELFPSDHIALICTLKWK